LADKFQYTYADPSITTNACISSSTPNGTYDSDNQFCSESVNVCKFVAKRLGHPVMQLEFNSGSIYAMFEESVSEYSQQINQYNMKNWLWEQIGSEAVVSGSEANSTGSSVPKHPHMGSAVYLSEQYGQAAGVGGNVTLKSGSVVLAEGQQNYDLQQIWGAVSESNNRIEIQRVFQQPPAAISRFYDPYVGTYDQRMMLDQFGFASYSPATTFVLRPLYYDVLRAQTIETSDYIRKSNYSFEVVNNQLKIFPIPTKGDVGSKIYFNYYVRNDRVSTTRDYTENTVSDPSNAPYKNLTYSEINAHGRQWIRKFALALSKELLGIIRSKYASMPLPNGEVSLDGEALKGEGREEKTQLLEELKEFLDSVSLTEKSKMEQEQADAQQQVLNKSPLGIYIG
tara:strand:+ start:108 stop:1298 length:1191 start_codon:yes stop_codon:yes gene_type:complete